MKSQPPRRQALIAAALLLSAPLLWGSTAHADPAGTVTFNGGCALDLLAPLGEVEPDPLRVVVEAGEEVRFDNGLGKRATLMLNGEAAVELPAGESVGVTFHGGPVTASMQISCLLGGLSGSATVEVLGSALPPAGPSATTGPPAGTARPGADATRATTPVPGNERPAAGPAGAGSTGSGSDPGPGSGSDAPAPAPPAGDTWSPPPGPGDTAPEDLTIPRWNIRPDPDSGGETSPGADTVDQEPGGQGQGQEAEQLSPTAGGGSGDGPNGTLALIATICLAGVTAGAIRAIVTQRSARTEWA